MSHKFTGSAFRVLSLPRAAYGRHCYFDRVINAHWSHSKSYNNGNKPGRRDQSTPVVSVTSAKTAQNNVKAALPPHSLLPTKVLLRSFLVATISSHRTLLIPALKILTMVAHPRIGLLDVNKNWLLRGTLKKSFYDHFCAGENGSEVTSTINHIKQIGFKGVILTYAREIVVGVGSQSASSAPAKNDESKIAIPNEKGAAINPEIEAWRDGVMETVELVGENDFLALKFSGAGPVATLTLTESKSLPDQMMQALKELCARAVQHKVRIFIDAEQQSIQPDGGPPTVYNTHQAYLKETPANLLDHLGIASRDTFAIGIKLVRGAYLNSEPRHFIHDTKEETDACYNSLAEAVIKRQYGMFGVEHEFPPSELFLASHNMQTVTSAHQLYQDRLANGEPTTKVQYGQLLGMADKVSFRMLQMKAEGQEGQLNGVLEVYKCLSWGTLGDCLSYLLRRAVENRDVVSRTLDEYQALRAEVCRRMKAYFGASS